MGTQKMERVVWMDWMRVTACLMVFFVHATEPFYLGGEGSRILTASDAFWASFFDSLARACVPIFVVASAYLQFPLHHSTSTFFKRRVVRVLIPFLIWILVYAFAYGDADTNLQNLAFNFNYAAGHLWFVYMITGLYLLMPLLSPWAEKVGKKELLFYLFICLFTSMIPLLRDILSNHSTEVIYGPTGIPRQALYPLWGEASWNGYGLFYYFSGFLGYLLLGLFFRKFAGDLSWKKTLTYSIPLWLAGFSITFFGFLWRVWETSGGKFPVEGAIDLAVWWETTWCNDTIGVAMMTIASLMMFRKITSSGRFYERIIIPISDASYGMYLTHILILVPLAGFVRGHLGSGNEGILGFWTTPVEIILSAVSAFVVTAVICILIRKIPKVGKFIMG